MGDGKNHELPSLLKQEIRAASALACQWSTGFIRTHRELREVIACTFAVYLLAKQNKKEFYEIRSEIKETRRDAMYILELDVVKMVFGDNKDDRDLRRQFSFYSKCVAALSYLGCDSAESALQTLDKYGGVAGTVHKFVKASRKVSANESGSSQSTDSGASQGGSVGELFSVDEGAFYRLNNTRDLEIFERLGLGQGTEATFIGKFGQDYRLVELRILGTEAA